MKADQLVDVRAEPRLGRFDLVLANFDALREGEHFVMLNDLDPGPLRSQIGFLREGKFSWDCIEDGPEVWCVRIGRTGA